MVIDLTRNEVLRLMGDLPGEHWFQTNLLEELLTFQPEPLHNNPQPYTVELPVDAKTLTATCEWECYGIKCDNQQTPTDKFCTNHTTQTCTVCGAKATHGCNMELQFVCGGPLCPAHTTCGHTYNYGR